MSVFNVKIKGLRDLQKNINNLRKGLGHFKTLNKMRVAGMDGFIEENFQKGGQPVVDGWKPLSRKTIKARRKGKRKASPKILIDNADLKNKRKQVVGTFGNEAKIVFDMPYANTHHFGDDSRNIPARPLYSNKAYRKTGKDQKIIQIWFNGQVKKAGTFIRKRII
jgi:phage gpG-like protein